MLIFWILVTADLFQLLLLVDFDHFRLVKCFQLCEKKATGFKDAAAKERNCGRLSSIDSERDALYCPLMGVLACMGGRPLLNMYWRYTTIHIFFFFNVHTILKKNSPCGEWGNHKYDQAEFHQPGGGRAVSSALECLGKQALTPPPGSRAETP